MAKNDLGKENAHTKSIVNHSSWYQNRVFKREYHLLTGVAKVFFIQPIAGFCGKRYN